jgi:hypothetical protein
VMNDKGPFKLVVLYVGMRAPPVTCGSSEACVRLYLSVV